MTDPKTHSARLQVGRARPPDVGRGAARLSPSALRGLEIEEGGIVEIVGKRRTAAVALRLPSEDRGLELLRIDGIQRANADVSIGDFVRVRPAQVTPAQRVEFAPAQDKVELSGAADALRRTLLNRVLVAGDVISTSTSHPDSGGAAPERESVQSLLGDPPAFGLQEIRLRVNSTTPLGIVQIAEKTEVVFVPGLAAAERARRADVTYDDLGGMDDAIRQVREMIELPLKHPVLFQRLGIDPPRGILLHGPPGTGKTLLARAVANEADARFFHIGGPEIMGQFHGESEQRLREIYEQARAQAPAIIFMDEIDSIAPKRESVSGDTDRRVVAQLLTLLDGLEPRGNVVVIGATNLVDTLDEALRRPGRFDREIAVGVPDRDGRRQILGIHTRGMPLARGVDLDEVARVTYGFVGADLAALVREAAMDALRRNLPRIDLERRDVLPETVQQLDVTSEDFAGARKRVYPSAMREIMVEIPNVRWDDLGGLEHARAVLRDGIELPLKHASSFRALGIRAAKGFLLFGPPGTGKTLLAKAVATEAEANFIGVKSSDLLSKWYGESERQVSRLFARARQVAPAIIFIDEIDSLTPRRGSSLGEPAVTERIVNTLLAEMDGLEELLGVVVIGATNRPALLDPAVLRPGRFDELVYVPAPERDARLHILGIHTRPMPLADDVRLEWLADRTSGFTGADLEGLVRRAGLRAFRDDHDVKRIPMSCFQGALDETRPSVTPAMAREYEEMLEELKRESPLGRRIGFFGEEEQASHDSGTPRSAPPARDR